jgi:hypothetical protein
MSIITAMEKFNYLVKFVGSSTEQGLQAALNEAAGTGFRCVHFQLDANGASWTLFFEKASPHAW